MSSKALTSAWLSKHSEQSLQKIREAVRLKGETRVRTDAIIPIPEGYMKLVADGRRNYEYRFKMPGDVVWLWFYVTAPTSAITHVALTGPFKNPGEVNDPTGAGNDEFDAGKKPGRKGYPIRKLYKLETPIKRVELINDFDVVTERGAMIPKASLVLARKIWLNLELVHDRTHTM